MSLKRYVIGRSNPKVTIRFPDSETTVSNLHAELTATEDGRYFLLDHHSANGTEVFANGGWKRIRQSWVGFDQPIRLGRRVQTTVKDLLAMADGNGAERIDMRTFTQQYKPERDDTPPAPKGSRRDRPRFNPETGELEWD